MLIKFWNQKVKDQGNSRQLSENIVSTICQKPIKWISPNFGHRSIWVHRCAD